MIARSIGIVICRVGAVLLFMQGLQSIGRMFYSTSGFFDNWSSILAGVVLLTGAPTAAGIALWVFADRICDFGHPPQGDDAIQTVPAADLISAGTYLIGVYVLVIGLINAVSIEIYSLAQPAFDTGISDSSQLDSQNFFMRINYVVRVVFGVALIGIGRRAQTGQHSSQPD